MLNKNGVLEDPPGFFRVLRKFHKESPEALSAYPAAGQWGTAETPSEQTFATG